MAREQIGTVAALARFPIKSMLGEAPRELEITTRGAVGDRAWALRELSNGRIVSAKKFGKLLEFSAAYDSEPAPDRAAPITITLPDGKKIHPDDPSAAETISAILGAKMVLERVENARAESAGIDPNTVFADVPVGDVIPGLTAETMPHEFPLAKLSFFDDSVMHVIATGTLKHATRLSPKSNFDPRRFRVTLLVDTGARDGAFVEDAWLAGVLAVGDSIKIAGMKPALRCAMTTHPQQDLPRDLDILRTVARSHKATLGVFANVTSGGRVRVGDPVWLER